MIGAVVVGGDFLGLGIVRSLGRHGIPVCVVDDEPSIARFSRFTSLTVRVPDLRHPDRTIAALLKLGSLRQLEGWVLFPTRDETVAAIAANADRLSTTSRTWYPASAADLDAIGGDGPFVIKPAIKEHFIYATKAKAWKAKNREELATLFERATRITGDGEIMVQDYIPGS